MKLDVEKKYEPAKVLIDSNNSNTSKSKETVAMAVVYQTIKSDELDVIDKLCKQVNPSSNVK